MADREQEQVLEDPVLESEDSTFRWPDEKEITEDNNRKLGQLRQQGFTIGGSVAQFMMTQEYGRFYRTRQPELFYAYLPALFAVEEWRWRLDRHKLEEPSVRGIFELDVLRRIQSLSDKAVEYARTHRFMYAQWSLSALPASDMEQACYKLFDQDKPRNVPDLLVRIVIDNHILIKAGPASRKEAVEHSQQRFHQLFDAAKQAGL